MRAGVLTLLTVPVVVLAWGAGPSPGRESPVVAEAVLEGVVRCGARRTMVVYVETAGDESAAPESAGRQAVIDQRGLRFVPHVLPVLVGTRVAFVNSDPVHHNVFSPSVTRPFNLGTYPPGVTRYVTFDRPGIVEVLCNVHPEMSAYVVVLSTPFFAPTDVQGAYRIDKLPTGPASVSAWCEVGGTERRHIELIEGSNRLDFDLQAGQAGMGRTRKDPPGSPRPTWARAEIEKGAPPR